MEFPAKGKVPLPRPEPAERVAPQISLAKRRESRAGINRRMREGSEVQSLPSRTASDHERARLHAQRYIQSLRLYQAGDGIRDIEVGAKEIVIEHIDGHGGPGSNNVVDRPTRCNRPQYARISPDHRNVVRYRG